MINLLQLAMSAIPPARRRFFWLGWLCVGVGMLVGSCRDESHRDTQSAPPAVSKAILSKEHDGALYFDERYLDSQQVHPQNARIQRQLAINTQLRRLSLARREVTLPPKQPRPAPASDSVFEHVNGGPLKGYANQQALLRDIYRQIDSLKRVQHLPITPH